MAAVGNNTSTTATTADNGEEKFSLKWNDHPESILGSFQELTADGEFVDVTLVCEGAHIRGHRLILSACSDFFRELLRDLKAVPNPVVVLWDVGAADMKKILNFMYNGEVEVNQGHLNAFLAVAERLRIRGLCNSGGKTSPEPPSQRRASTAPSPSPRSPSRRPSNSDFPSGGGGRSRNNFEDESGRSRSRSPLASGSGMRSSRDFLEQGDRSRGGSDHDFDGAGGDGMDFGGGEMDEHGGLPGIPSHLMAGMGMAGGMFDRAATKEFFRRAMTAGLLTGSASMPGSLNSVGSPSSASSPLSGHAHVGGGAGGNFRGGVGGADENPGRRQRSVYTSTQIMQLETYFQSNEYIDGERKRQLSLLTQIPEQQIKVWFQNRRQKKKREQEEHVQREEIRERNSGGEMRLAYERPSPGELDIFKREEREEDN